MPSFASSYSHVYTASSSQNSFQNMDTYRSRSSSRPSSSSSNSSYAYLPTAHSPYSLQPSPISTHSAPGSPGMTRLRPLPTPPTTPQNTLGSSAPRPLPHPPLQRAQSTQHLRAPLPTPPPSAPNSAPLSSKFTRAAVAAATTAHNERPSISLKIPSTPESQRFPTPLSPIAFNLPGPRDLRKRREEELSRRMKALGFVESPRDDVPAASSHDPKRGTPCSPTESDDERDVVLLIQEDDSDADEPPRAPKTATRRPAMPTPPSSADGARSASRLRNFEQQNHSSGRATPQIEIKVEVEVEVITKESVAFSKRRYSRKWVRERRGKRWTEKDFGEVISQLRKLR